MVEFDRNLSDERVTCRAARMMHDDFPVAFSGRNTNCLTL